MARVARFKIGGQEAWYHIHSRIAGFRGDYSLSEAAPTRKLIEIIEHFSTAYFCKVVAFCVMGNHYHLVVGFEESRTVDREALRDRACTLYPNSASQIDCWDEEHWVRLRERLFDVSELMRNIQAAFARWYNRTYGRRGRFWADRFKSVYLEDRAAVLDCMLYVELNPVRAGLVERPEEWQGSSLVLREIGKDSWLEPLTRFVETSAGKALTEYRERMYYRGSVPTKEGQAAISEAVLDAEIARGFEASGVYLKRLAYFVDGIAIGSETFIRTQLTRLREEGQYLRRKNPIPQLGGIHLSLREQRGHALTF